MPSHTGKNNVLQKQTCEWWVLIAVLKHKHTLKLNARTLSYSYPKPRTFPHEELLYEYSPNSLNCPDFS